MESKHTNKDDELFQLFRSAYVALTQQVEAAVKARDYSEALNAIDNAIVTISPSYKSSVYQLKFTTLLAYDAAQAIALVKEIKEEFPFVETWAARTIYDTDGLDAATYRFAVEIFSKMVATGKGVVRPIIQNIIAECYYKMNDLSNAIAAKEKAIEFGNAVIAAKENQPAFNSNTVGRYEDELATYKCLQKKDWGAYEKAVTHLVNTHFMANSIKLARYAWDFCANEEIVGKASLNEAFKWIEKAVEKDHSLRNRAIHAALLFKLGRRKEALPLAKEILRECDETGEHLDVATRLRKACSE